ncbi:MAG: helix-turn-helix domain-containing protein [Cyanobacteriota bacterium]
MNNEISEKIKYFRKEILKLTQKELCDKLGITLSYLSNIENGKRYLSNKMINKLDALSEDKSIILTIKDLSKKEKNTNEPILNNENIQNNEYSRTDSQKNSRHPREELAQEIKKVREIELNFTQKELAEKIGVSRSYIAVIEAAKNIPTMKVIKKIYNLTDKKEISNKTLDILKYLHIDNSEDDNPEIPKELARELSNLFYTIRTNDLKLPIEDFAKRFNLSSEELESIENSTSIPEYYTICTLLNSIKETKFTKKRKLLLVELETIGINIRSSNFFIGIESLKKQSLLSDLLNLRNTASGKLNGKGFNFFSFYFTRIPFIQINYKKWLNIFSGNEKKESINNFLTNELNNFKDSEDYNDYRLMINSELSYNFLLIGKEEKSIEKLNKAKDYYNLIKESKKSEIISTYNFLSFIYWELFLLGENKKANLENFISDIKTYILENNTFYISFYQRRIENNNLYLIYNYFKIVPFLAKAYLYLEHFETEHNKKLDLINNGELYLTLRTPHSFEPKEKWFGVYYFECACFFSLKVKILSSFLEGYDSSSDLEKCQTNLEIFAYSLFRQDKNSYKKIFEQQVKESSDLESFKEKVNYIDLIYNKFDY